MAPDPMAAELAEATNGWSAPTVERPYPDSPDGRARFRAECALLDGRGYRPTGWAFDGYHRLCRFERATAVGMPAATPAEAIEAELGAVTDGFRAGEVVRWCEDSVAGRWREEAEAWVMVRHGYRLATRQPVMGGAIVTYRAQARPFPAAARAGRRVGDGDARPAGAVRGPSSDSVGTWATRVGAAAIVGALLLRLMVPSSDPPPAGGPGGGRVVAPPAAETLLPELASFCRGARTDPTSQAAAWCRGWEADPTSANRDFRDGQGMP